MFLSFKNNNKNIDWLNKEAGLQKRVQFPNTQNSISNLPTLFVGRKKTNSQSNSKQDTKNMLECHGTKVVATL